MNGEQMLENHDLQTEEHKAWIDMFQGFCKELGINTGQGNRDMYRKFFHLVETWGQEFARMRIYQRDNKIFDITERDGRILGEKSP